jgi:hypothetical protein
VGIQIIVPESVDQILEAVLPRRELQGQNPFLSGFLHGMRALIPIVEIAGQKDLFGFVLPKLDDETALVSVTPYHHVLSPPKSAKSKSPYRDLEMISSGNLNIVSFTAKSRTKFVELERVRVLLRFNECMTSF